MIRLGKAWNRGACYDTDVVVPPLMPASLGENMDGMASAYRLGMTDTTKYETLSTLVIDGLSRDAALVAIDVALEAGEISTGEARRLEGWVEVLRG